ncbi:hypothetical protein [Burkholderia sp. Cy-637]|uniref:hypothetical protein n=1 Tax=Burkholderia sp. Cy-637 TaxID=2608327 RepID=UPI001424A3DB|nr:hypothetical protein [Burkholderia sp. Cy-637]NIF93621.1 hypothetical protein [Burkholderia sp. Cy-637]
MATKFEAKKLRPLSIAIACGGLLTMAQWSPGTVPMPPAKLADMCNVDASGNVMPSQTVIGHISQVQDSYFVRDGNGITTLVSKCFKGGCAPFSRTLVKGHTGEPVQAEFCGNHPARLVISGVEVYRLTQQVIDENVTGIQHMQSRMRSIGAAWFGAWLLFQFSIEWLGRRRKVI